MNPFEANQTPSRDQERKLQDARIFSPQETQNLMAGLTPEQRKAMEELKQSLMEEKSPETQRMPQGAMEKNIEDDAQEERRIRERLAKIADPAEREPSPIWNAEDSAAARNAALAAARARKGSNFGK